jgi:hypothetical protein
VSAGDSSLSGCPKPIRRAIEQALPAGERLECLWAHGAVNALALTKTHVLVVKRPGVVRWHAWSCPIGAIEAVEIRAASRLSTEVLIVAADCPRAADTDVSLARIGLPNTVLLRTRDAAEAHRAISACRLSGQTSNRLRIQE